MAAAVFMVLECTHRRYYSLISLAPNHSVQIDKRVGSQVCLAIGGDGGCQTMPWRPDELADDDQCRCLMLERDQNPEEILGRFIFSLSGCHI